MGHQGNISWANSFSSKWEEITCHEWGAVIVVRCIQLNVTWEKEIIYFFLFDHNFLSCRRKLRREWECHFWAILGSRLLLTQPHTHTYSYIVTFAHVLKKTLTHILSHASKHTRTHPHKHMNIHACRAHTHTPQNPDSNDWSKIE